MNDEARLMKEPPLTLKRNEHPATGCARPYAKSGGTLLQRCFIAGWLVLFGWAFDLAA